MTKKFELLADALLAAHVVGFAFFRLGELFPFVARYGTRIASSLLCAAFVAVRLEPGGRRFLVAAAILALTYVLDAYLPATLPARDGAPSGLTVAVTGANSGVGREVSRRLSVDYGARVFMGCRSEAKCRDASDAINAEASSAGSVGVATPLRLDLDDLESVKSFASGLKVDVLLNNAGYWPSAGTPTNEYGLEPSFASMHLAHFYLAELLSKTNPRLRTVNTASIAHQICAMPFHVLPRFAVGWLPGFVLPQRPGCVDEYHLGTGIRSKPDSAAAAYMQAKMMNVMHATELPRRHAGAAAVAVDLGWVGTSIQPFMNFRLSPANLGWMRSVSSGATPVLRAILATNAELLANRKQDREDGGVVMNGHGRVEEAFSYPWWRDCPNGDLSQERMSKLSKLLWEESERILRDIGYDW